MNTLFQKMKLFNIQIPNLETHRINDNTRRKIKYFSKKNWESETNKTKLIIISLKLSKPLEIC